MSCNWRVVTLVFCFLSVAVLSCEARSTEVKVAKNMEYGVGRMMEEGRTMVHHAMKRFMIILPAIFFKLGIAFTMLILVTIVSVNNGFIGFLLLVVGLSSVLARLQGSHHGPSAVPYISPLPPYHHHYIDRSDHGIVDGVKSTNNGYGTIGQQQFSPSLSGFNSKYTSYMPTKL